MAAFHKHASERALRSGYGGNYQNCYCFQRPLVIGRFSWRDCSAGANRRDPSHPPGFGKGVTTDRTPSGGTGPTQAQPASLGSEELALAERSPRAIVLASLASALGRAVTLGDEVAARVLHEAIGRLLVSAHPRAS